MAYKFGTDEPVRRAILRCAGEQLDRAILELSERVDADPIAAVHNARKAIKKERSLLRLARGAMSGKQRQRGNVTLREVARGLSNARDADVMIAATAQLSERFAGQLPAQAFEAVGAHLEARRSAEPGHRNGRVVGADALEELAAVRASLGHWHLRQGGWKALRSGLLRSHRRGRDAFGPARSSGETADLHAWRKRVKDLWYHERLLAPTCGPTVRAHAKELGRLADVLGEDHDLALLSQDLTRNRTTVAADLEALLNLIDHRRAELQTEAAHIGERVYAEKPKAFERRMHLGWKAGRALTRVPRSNVQPCWTLRLGEGARTCLGRGLSRTGTVPKITDPEAQSPSQSIDARIEGLDDWRGATLSRVRALIKQADPGVVEEWKWRKATNPGVPVWSHDGMICTGETYKSVVKLTFFKGASLKDPAGLFNSSLDGNTRRAIDLHEGEEIDEQAFVALIRAAVSLNQSGR